MENEKQFVLNNRTEIIGSERILCNEPNDTEKVETDQNVIDIYNLLREQFDSIVDIVSDTLQIHGNSDFWRKALKQYVASESYCYPWLTEFNLPYIFCCKGLQNCNIHGLKFLQNSPAHRALALQCGVQFSEPDADGYCTFKNAPGFSLNFRFHFSDHKQIAKAGEIVQENMKFCIQDCNHMNVTLFSTVIEFDEFLFYNEIKENETSRKQKLLLDIAGEEMPPLQI